VHSLGQSLAARKIHSQRALALPTENNNNIRCRCRLQITSTGHGWVAVTVTVRYVSIFYSSAVGAYSIAIKTHRWDVSTVVLTLSTERRYCYLISGMWRIMTPD